MSAFQKFNIFAADIGNKVHNLNADTLALVLLDAAPAVTDTAYNDTNHTLTGSGAAEIATGNGYTQGGTTVGSTAYSQSSGTGKLTGNAVTWTASGGAIAQFRYVALVNKSGGSAGARPVIGFWDIAAEQNIASGNAFTFGASNAGANWTSGAPLLSLS